MGLENTFRPGETQTDLIQRGPVTSKTNFSCKPLASGATNDVSLPRSGVITLVLNNSSGAPVTFSFWLPDRLDERIQFYVNARLCRVVSMYIDAATFLVDVPAGLQASMACNCLMSGD